MKTIKDYLQSKQGSWSDTTLRSESARLHAASDVLDCHPLDAHERLTARLKPYAVKTTMLRIADYRAFTGDYSWKQFIKQNARLYKNAYTRSVDGLSYEEIERRASLLTDVATRNIIMDLLHSGIRACEVRTRDSSDMVLGKGSKRRKVFGASRLTPEARATVDYRTIYQACKAIDCTPHQCRKAFASKLARSGKVTEVDLLRVMGWASMETAKSYLQPMRDEQLANTLRGVFDGGA